MNTFPLATRMPLKRCDIFVSDGFCAWVILQNLRSLVSCQWVLGLNWIHLLFPVFSVVFRHAGSCMHFAGSCMHTQILCQSKSSNSLKYTHKNEQVVTNLKQTCSNAVPTTCQQECFWNACSQLVDNFPSARLLSSTDLLRVVPTTCYRPAIQQFVNKLWVTTL
jgi:hypothetical protein